MLCNHCFTFLNENNCSVFSYDLEWVTFLKVDFIFLRQFSLKQN